MVNPGIDPEIGFGGKSVHALRSRTLSLVFRPGASKPQWRGEQRWPGTNIFLFWDRKKF